MRSSSHRASSFDRILLVTLGGQKPRRIVDSSAQSLFWRKKVTHSWAILLIVPAAVGASLELVHFIQLTTLELPFSYQGYFWSAPDCPLRVPFCGTTKSNLAYIWFLEPRCRDGTLQCDCLETLRISMITAYLAQSGTNIKSSSCREVCLRISWG